MSIFKQSRPIQTTLKDFGNCCLPTKMPPTSLVIKERNDTSNVIVSDTPPKNLIRAIFEQIRIILIEKFH